MLKRMAIVPLLLGLAIVGCGPSNPMVGTWKLELSEDLKKLSQSAGAGNMTMEFKGDNTVTMTATGAGKTESQSGTYTLTDKTLKIKMTGGTAMANQEQTWTLSDDMKSFDMSFLGKMVKQ